LTRFGVLLSSSFTRTHAHSHSMDPKLCHKERKMWNEW